MRKIYKIINNFLLTFKEGGIRRVIQLFVRYLDNILGGCGLKIEVAYKLHHFLSRISYKFYSNTLIDIKVNFDKFIKEEYVVLDLNLPKNFLDDLLKKCEHELQNEENTSKIANKKNKPFNGLLNSGVPPEYYSKQVCWLNNPSLSVPELLTLFNNKLIDDVLKSLFRSNYIIENIAMYKTLNSNKKETFNLNSSFHIDSNPSTSLKMMIYLCDVDNNNGPLLIKEKSTGKIIPIIGKSGTSIIFKSHSLYHAAKNTSTGSRYAVFFTIVPSFRPWKNQVTCDGWLNIPYRINPFFWLGK